MGKIKYMRNILKFKKMEEFYLKIIPEQFFTLAQKEILFNNTLKLKYFTSTRGGILSLYIATAGTLSPTISQIIPYNVSVAWVKEVENIAKSSERRLEMNVFTFPLRT